MPETPNVPLYVARWKSLLLLCLRSRVPSPRNRSWHIARNVALNPGTI